MTNIILDTGEPLGTVPPDAGRRKLGPEPEPAAPDEDPYEEVGPENAS